MSQKLKCLVFQQLQWLKNLFRTLQDNLQAQNYFTVSRSSCALRKMAIKVSGAPCGEFRQSCWELPFNTGLSNVMVRTPGDDPWRGFLHALPSPLWKLIDDAWAVRVATSKAQPYAVHPAKSLLSWEHQPRKEKRKKLQLCLSTKLCKRFNQSCVPVGSLDDKRETRPRVACVCLRLDGLNVDFIRSRERKKVNLSMVE